MYHILSLSLNCRYFSVYLYMPVALVSTQPKCLLLRKQRSAVWCVRVQYIQYVFRFCCFVFVYVWWGVGGGTGGGVRVGGGERGEAGGGGTDVVA